MPQFKSVVKILRHKVEIQSNSQAQRRTSQTLRLQMKGRARVLGTNLDYNNSKLQPTRCNVSWFIYFYRRSTSFRRFLRPSSGAHNCTYSFRYCQPILLLAAIVDEMELVSSISSTIAASSSIGWQYLKLYVQLCAPDDGRRNRLKHVQRLWK